MTSVRTRMNAMRRIWRLRHHCAAAKCGKFIMRGEQAYDNNWLCREHAVEFQFKMSQAERIAKERYERRHPNPT